MTKTQELGVVAWLCTRPTDHGPEESLSLHPITDGDRSLGWHDEPLVAQSAASAIIKGLEEERDEALAAEQEWLEKATYEVGAVPHLWKDRALAAEAERDALRKALEPFASISEVPALGHVTKEMVLAARQALSGSKEK